MAIVESVSEQIKDAMRAQDKGRTAALRNIRAAFIAEMKKDGASTLSDEQAVGVIRGLEKQRRESIEAYRAGGRADLVAEEETELAILQEFLPKLADEATTRAWIQEAIAATNAASKAEMGKVMGHLMKHHRAELDGKLANRLVAEALGA